MIETEDLKVGYPNKLVLNKINTAFEPGMLTVIIGPNGCGKSSFIRTVLGLQEKLGGRVLIDGQDAEALGRRVMAKSAAYMAQNRQASSINAQRMVLHGRFPYLSFPRRYRKEDYEAADAALKKADAYELSKCFLPELSGGQRQKVYLAMALAQDTGTLFLDEPTAFLDMEHQLMLMEMGAALAHQGRAVVMVLHDLCLAMHYADRIIVFDKGEIISQGVPDEVYSSGIIDDTFNVGFRRIMTDEGWQYYCTAKR